MSAMSTADRAKQFLPFNALKGFEEAVGKRRKLDFEPVLMGEDAETELDKKIHDIAPGDIVRVVFYGNREFNERCGRVKKIHEYERLLELEEAKIRINDIISLEKENE